ncbi:MAG: WecB/TagA/CpsF family glycosyltransferase [Ignavibacteria bacterium]
MTDVLNILNTKVHNVTCQEIMDIIYNSVVTRNAISIHYANSYTLLLNRYDKQFAQNSKDISYFFPDGIGVYIASKFLYGKNGLRGRGTGTDLYFMLMEDFPKRNITFFFYGGSAKAIEKLKEKFEKEGKSQSIVGLKPRDFSNHEKIIDEINSTMPDILFIGLGTPYQEEFFTKYRHLINVPVVMFVGSGIDFIAGTLRRAPLFMRLVGLEWLFRLLVEPGRLWKRYIIGIPCFIISIIYQKLKSKSCEAQLL